MDDETETPVSVAIAEEQSADKHNEVTPVREIDALVNVAAAPAPTNTQDTATAADMASQSVDTWQAENSARLAGIQDELAALRRDFESKLQYDASKQQQLDTMHQELESYRRDSRLQVLRPIFTDLITLYADLDKVIQRWKSEQKAEQQTLTQYQEQIEEVLRRNGAERFTTSDDTLDAKRQRVIDTTPTTDPALDKRVAERLKPGFEYEGRIVLQAEQVKTYRYVPQDAQPTE